MKRISITLYIYLVFSIVTQSQEVTVKTDFDTSRIFIGDQVLYTMTIDKPVGYLLNYPVFKDTLFSKIEILSGPTADTVMLKDGRMRIRNQYLVTSFDSGFYQVPPVFAELRSETGIKRFYSDYSPLEVMRVRISPPDSTAKFFDIIKPYRAPLTAGEILPWIFLVLLISGLTWYLIRYFKKLRKKNVGEVIPESTDPADVIAFRDLETLKADMLWQKGEIKQYYIRLSEIVRKYLWNRYNINSLELTTLETLDELVRHGFRKGDSYNLLKDLLTGADLAKFAKYRPDADENELQFNRAWIFVDTTKEIIQKPVSEPEENEDKEAVR